ncbi:MAG: hypothetical protein KDA42_10695 [Planctomycetales bacterium]|nr:hypothetical protein [Planctomycetales bacterium]
MFQRFATHLSIAIVLVCPYLCLGSAEGCSTADVQKDKCCCHCDSREANDDAPPTPRDSGPDCLCHGAVIDGAKIELQTFADDSALVATLYLPTSMFVEAQSVAVSPHPCHFPPGSSGRDLCALNCALLL